jgi:propanediol dehydratase large subunit
LQVVELSASVDQVRRRDWPLVIERIHRTSVYGNPVQIQTEAGDSCG